MAAYLFNNNRDQETNRLMGVVIFLVLSLIFTIVISVSVFLIYLDDYTSIQNQYYVLEEKLQQIKVENYEKNSDYSKLNFELNEVKSEIDKLTKEKLLSAEMTKVVASFIDDTNKENFSEAEKFLKGDIVIEQNYKNNGFPTIMVSGQFNLENDFKGDITYFSIDEEENFSKYVFNMVKEEGRWFIEGISVKQNITDEDFLIKSY